MPCFQSCDGRSQSNGTGNSVEHHIGFGVRRHLGGSELADRQFRCIAAHGSLFCSLLDCSCELFLGFNSTANQGGTVLDCLLREPFKVVATADGSNREEFWGAVDDVQPLGADGTGGTDQADPAWVSGWNESFLGAHPIHYGPFYCERPKSATPLAKGVWRSLNGWVLETQAAG